MGIVVRVEYLEDFDDDQDLTILVTEPAVDAGRHHPVFADSLCRSLMTGLYDAMQKIRESGYPPEVEKQLGKCERHGYTIGNCAMCLRDDDRRRERETDELLRESRRYAGEHLDLLKLLRELTEDVDLTPVALRERINEWLKSKETDDA